MTADSDIKYLTTGPVAKAGAMVYYHSRIYFFLVGSEGKKPVVTECRPYIYDIARNAIITQGLTVSVYPLFACTIANSMLLFGWRFDYRGKYIVIKKLLADRKAFTLRDIGLDQPKCDDFFLGFVYKDKYALLVYHSDLKNLLFVYNSQTLKTQIFPSPFNEVPKTCSCSIVWNNCLLITNTASIELPSNLESLLEHPSEIPQDSFTIKDIQVSGELHESLKRARPVSPSSGRKVYRHSSGLLDVVRTTGYKVIEKDFDIYTPTGLSVSQSGISHPVEMDPLSEISVQMPIPHTELSSPTQADSHMRTRSQYELPIHVPVSGPQVRSKSPSLHFHSKKDSSHAIEASITELRGELQVLRNALTATDEREVRLHGRIVSVGEEIGSLGARCTAIEQRLTEYIQKTDAAVADLQQRVAQLE